NYLNREVFTQDASYLPDTVGETFRFRKARYPERDTPKNFSIPEVETRRLVTLAASTLAETSV
ncbi:MAG: hypothetical protein ACI4TA_13365, partial [Acetatifactor sp.]